MSEINNGRNLSIEDYSSEGQMKSARQDTTETYRIHRVGTITCGLIFILYGILFLLHMVVPYLSYKVIFDLWPVILVFLGVEILLSCTRKNQENRKFVYDFGAFLLILIMAFFAMIMAAVDYGMWYGGYYGW